jgi:hypothetical protein
MGSGGPPVVGVFPDHGAACLVDSDVRRTRNGFTGGGASLAAGSLRLSPSTRRAPLRSQRQLDKVGISWLPSFEPFGLSSRSCCSTGRLMRSSPLWWCCRSEASTFSSHEAHEQWSIASGWAGWGRARSSGLSTNGCAPSAIDFSWASQNNKLSYSVTAGVVSFRLAKDFFTR